jgi:hypothetical protein
MWRRGRSASTNAGLSVEIWVESGKGRAAWRFGVEVRAWSVVRCHEWADWQGGMVVMVMRGTGKQRVRDGLRCSSKAAARRSTGDCEMHAVVACVVGFCRVMGGRG